MNSRRLVAIVAGAAVLAVAAWLLRSGVEPPPRPVTGPDGKRIAAYHDPALVTPPRRPGGPPHRPGPLHVDARRGGALLYWPPAPYSFEVRWSGTGRGTGPGQTGGVRLVATPATGLDGLPPGRYHVDVRSVDEVGQRSEPTGADVEVSDAVPSWQQGLGFVDDFTAGAALDADRWRLPDFARRCLRREGNPGPLLLDGRCGGTLRPASPLVLAESGDVRGRVVVLADAPAPPPPSAAASGPSADRPDDIGSANYLVVGVAPQSPVPSAFTGVQLLVGARDAYLSVNGASQVAPVGPVGPAPGQPLGAPADRLDTPAGGSPGALHRWELVFTADEVRAYLDGQPIGSAAYHAPWQRAEVTLAASVFGDSPVPVGARVGLVGLTGPGPDGRAIELVELLPEPPQPAAEQHFTVVAAPTAQQARVTGVLASPGPEYGPGSVPDYRPPPPPEVLADIGGLPLQLHRQPSAYPDDPSEWFAADVPAQAVRAGGTLTLRSAGGAIFVAVQAELEIIQQPGAGLDVQQPSVYGPVQPTLPNPRLTVRNGGRAVTGSDPAPRGTLDVEVNVDAVPTQAVGRGVGGWVALRVELDGRRILDFPTATDGPAVAGTYRFRLDTTDLPGGYHPLVVSLIPDRAGQTSTADRMTLRLMT